MKRKLMVFTLVFAMLASLSPAVAADKMPALSAVEENTSEYPHDAMSIQTADISADSTDLIMFNPEREHQINELFAHRSKLEVDFEENVDAIQKIDEQLAQLGVEEISHGELLSKMGYDALPAANVDTSEVNTLWTSRRNVVIFRGQQYEIQIIEGVPKNGESSLRMNYGELGYENPRITAGVTEIIQHLGIAALGGVPVLEFTGAVTIMDVVSEITGSAVDNLQPTTVFRFVDKTGLASFSSHMKVIFVKGYGSSDSYQVLGYVGNFVTYNVGTLFVTDSEMTEHGSTGEIEADLDFERTAYSEHFYDYSIAVQNYYNYRNNVNAEYICEYTINYIAISIVGEEKNFAVPHGIPYVSF